MISVNKTILLTGFEPFGGSDINPSILACKEIEDIKIGEFMVKVLEVPLRYTEIRETLENAIIDIQPSAVICTGQSPRPVISLERIAINIADIQKSAYNCGATPKDEILDNKGNDGYFSTLPIRDIYEKLKENKIPAEISNSAGTYGCNQIFYHLMSFINKNEYNIPAGFIHVPSLPEQVIGKNYPSMSLELIIKAIKIAIETVINYLEK